MRGATAIADTVRRLGTQLREDRRERGPHVADAAWVDEPFDDWLAMLHEGKPLARTSMLALAVGMDQTLAVRDALIVSIVGGADGARKAVLMDFASRPHAPEVCARMGRLLTAAFTDEHGGLDKARCRAAVGALKDMVGIVPERYRVQPLTIMAYVLWWLGKDEAVEYALEALAIDERCSLAAIVLGAMRRAYTRYGCADAAGRSDRTVAETGIIVLGGWLTPIVDDLPLPEVRPVCYSASGRNLQEDEFGHEENDDRAGAGRTDCQGLVDGEDATARQERFEEDHRQGRGWFR